MTKNASRELPFSDSVIPPLNTHLRHRTPPGKADRSSFSKKNQFNNKTLSVTNGPPSSKKFTIIELLVVIAIIIALADLVLGTVRYVQKKGARSRAKAEIAAISAACESYKADNGIYPRGNAADPTSGTAPFDTDNENARSDGNPGNYVNASLFLYKVLTGDYNANRQIGAGETGKSYFTFKPNMLAPTGNTGNVTAIRDPFGNNYSYSTAYQYNPNIDYNPTFDLWSTAGVISTSNPPDQSQ